MWQLTLVLMVAAVAAAEPAKTLSPTPAQNETFPRTPGTRIVGGSSVQLGQIPWQVSIQGNVGPSSLLPIYQHFCGGSIISPSVVLTAGHCFIDLDSGKWTIDPATLRVVAGTIYWASLDSKAQTRKVKKIVVHPKYYSKNNRRRKEWFDIAVMTLMEPFKLDKYTNTVPLIDYKINPGTWCNVSGWGHPIFGAGVVSADLRATAVPTISNKLCGQLYPENPKSGILCTLREGHDACQGDSGGPVVCNGMLAGVVSFGKNCGLKDNPGVQTDVYSYRKWIAGNGAATTSPLAVALSILLALALQQTSM